jgi:hypothetical protein
MLSLYKILLRYPISDVKKAYIDRILFESERIADLSARMDRIGFEEVSAPTDALLTVDGREVLQVHGKKWALSPSAHTKRLEVEFSKHSKDQTLETKSVLGTESLSAMVCPKCGDSLQHTSVCPKCPAGKLGYRHRYTCVCGGVDLVSKDKL